MNELFAAALISNWNMEWMTKFHSWRYLILLMENDEDSQKARKLIDLLVNIKSRCRV